MPKTKNLTTKEMALIELISQGIDEIDAAMRVYDCKDRKVASTIKNQVLGRERVRNELKKIEETRRVKVIEKGKKIADYIGELMSDKELAELLVRNAKSNDRRLSDPAIDKILKLKSAYPPAIYGIYRDLQKEQESVLTEADLARLIEKRKETPQLPEETGELPIITPEGTSAG